MIKRRKMRQKRKKKKSKKKNRTKGAGKEDENDLETKRKETHVIHEKGKKKTNNTNEMVTEIFFPFSFLTATASPSVLLPSLPTLLPPRLKYSSLMLVLRVPAKETAPESPIRLLPRAKCERE